MQFASVPLTGFAQGFIPIVSYNYGHGDKQRVKDCFRIALITMFSFNLILMLLMILFPSTVASAFTSDEKLIETVRWTMPVFLGGMTISACNVPVRICLLHWGRLRYPFYRFAPQGYSVDSVSIDTAALYGSDRGICG